MAEVITHLQAGNREGLDEMLRRIRDGLDPDSGDDEPPPASTGSGKAPAAAAGSTAGRVCRTCLLKGEDGWLAATPHKRYGLKCPHHPGYLPPLQRALPGGGGRGGSRGRGRGGGRGRGRGRGRGAARVGATGRAAANSSTYNKKLTERNAKYLPNPAIEHAVYFVFDLESTGLSWRQDGIIEIAAQALDSNGLELPSVESQQHGLISSTFHSMVHTDRDISAGATIVHGITANDLTGSDGWNTVGRRFNAYLSVHLEAVKERHGAVVGVMR